MARGGSRPGAGRKSSLQQEEKRGTDAQETITSSSTIDPLKELQKLYKQVDKCSDKTEMMKLQIKIDLLNKMLPFINYKKPTQETKQVDQATKVEITGIDLENL